MKIFFRKYGGCITEMYRIFAAAILFLVCFFLAGIFFLTKPVYAESPYVYDGYGLFSEEEDKKLEEECREFHQAHPGLEAYFITVDNETAGGATDWYTQEYVEQFAQSHSDGNSIAMIINMESRYYYVDVYGDYATKCYPYNQQDKIRDRIVEHLYDDDFYGAAETFLAQTEKYSSDSKLEGFGIADIAVCLIIAVILSLVITGVRASKHRNVKIKKEASGYLVSNSMRFKVHNDRFIRSYTTTVRKSEPGSSGGGGGYSSAGHSSGHSGGGGHF